MMIRVRNIPEEGVDLDFSIPVSLVKSSFVKGDETAKLFDKEVTCSIHLDANKKDVYLRGIAKTALNPTCSRCGESFSYPYSIPLNLACQPAEKKQTNSYEESD